MILLLIPVAFFVVVINFYSFLVAYDSGLRGLFPGFVPLLDWTCFLIGLPGVILGLLIGIITFRCWTEWI